MMQTAIERARVGSSPSAISNIGSAVPLGTVGRALAVMVALALCAIAALPASALARDQFVEFGPSGTGAGQTRTARGMAIDPRNGHLFLADQENRRVDEFTPLGRFVKAFGWDVAPAGVDEEQEVRVRAAEGTFVLGMAGELTAPLSLGASAAEVEGSLTSLASIGPGGAEVEERVGTAGGVTPFIYRVAFKGNLRETNVPQISVANGSPPLSGGDPSTSIEATTITDGTVPGTGLEACTTASGCKQAVVGQGDGEVGLTPDKSGPQALAVDANGGVYVSDPANNRIQKFSSAGRFLWMIGGDVNKTKSEEAGSTDAERDLCAGGSGDVCQAGVEGSGSGQIDSSLLGNYLAIDPDSGNLLVGGKDRIQQFSANGAYIGTVALPASWADSYVFSLVPIAGGEFWVTRIKHEAPEPGAAEQWIRQPDVYKVDGTTSTVSCSIAVELPEAIARGADGGVFVAENEGPFFRALQVRRYDQDCKDSGESFAQGEFDSFSTGLAVNAAGDVYAANLSLGGEDSYLQGYGPFPARYESPPPLPPLIAAQYARSVGSASATVVAEVNPRFWPDARYFVQYGPLECVQSEGWDAGCVQDEPAAPGSSLTTSYTDKVVPTAGVGLGPLRPGTAYAYRFVAESGGGGPVSGLEGEVGHDGSAATFRTLAAPSGLPDGRVYEKVSPAQKESGEVGIPTPAGGGAESSVQPQQASEAGGTVTYASATAFGERVESAPAASQYLSAEGADGAWATANITPRFGEGFLSEPFVGFTPSLDYGAAIVREPTLTSDATPGYENLYWRDNATGVLRAVTNSHFTPQISNSITRHDYCLFYGGAADDGSRLYFGAKGALTPGDPVSSGNNAFNLYEWSASRPAGEAIRLVSVLPDATPAVSAGEGQHSTSFGVVGSSVEGCQTMSVQMRHAVSSNGSHAVWTYAGSYEGALEPLFDATAGGTVQLDEPQGVPGVGGEGVYQDASLDGSKVFFTDKARLTPDAPGAASGLGSLYRYDFEGPEDDRLTDITAGSGDPQVIGVVGAGASGSSIYFVAKGDLSGPQKNPFGEEAEAGAMNLYQWQEEVGIRFIARLAVEGDHSDWSPSPNMQTARAAPDGNAVAFLSTRSLTGFDNHVASSPGCVITEAGLGQSPQCSEAFLYNANEESLSCVSCSPSGSRPLGPTLLPTWSTPYSQPRYLSDDGRRMFFETLDELVAGDENGRRDVYEFERPGEGSCTEGSAAFVSTSNGCLFLISDGASSDESYFVDASADGADAFISTRSRLQPLVDQDERYDVYDARVGGSAPAAPTFPACEGEACRGPGSAAGPAPDIGSRNFSGPGNPAAKTARCRKGTHRVRHHGRARCVKRRKMRRKQHRRHHHRTHHQKAKHQGKREAAK